MGSDRTIGRYRRWYARLLRLYPRSFRERFGEPMAYPHLPGLPEAPLIAPRIKDLEALHARDL